MSKSAYFCRKEESLVNALIHTAFRAGSLPIQDNIDKSATTQCFDIEKFEYLDRQSGYIQFEVIDLLHALVSTQENVQRGTYSG